MFDWFEDWGLTPTEERFLITALILLALWVVRLVVLRVVRGTIDDVTIWYRTRKIISYVVFLVAVLVISPLWLEGGNYATYIGLVSAGVAIALADVLKNLAGWVYIVLRRPFRNGDRVEISGQIGDVIDIRVFRFSMVEVGNWVHADQSTGRIIHVPNGLLFTNTLANYTEGFAFIWHEIEVLVTFESDWELAERLILESLEEHAVHHDPARAMAEILRTAEAYQIRYTHLTPAVYLTVKDSGVLLTGRLLCEARRRRSVDAAVWKSILRRFAAEPSVELAYPTVRTFLPDRLRVDTGGATQATPTQ